MFDQLNNELINDGIRNIKYNHKRIIGDINIVK